MSAPSILQAMTSPLAFGELYAAPSWRSWMAILKAAYALPLDDAELAIFADLAGGRAPPKRRVRELWVAAGRRSGKDSVAALIAAYAGGIEEAHIGRLRPGEKASVLCLASDRDQARLVLNYTKALIAETEGLATKVRRETAHGVDLDNDVEIVVTTNSYRAARGRAVLLAILDEVAFYRDENSASPDLELYRSLVPGLATLSPESMIVAISSPHKAAGLLYSKYVKHFGKDGDDVLFIQAPTLKLNPTIDPAIIEAALEEDPEAAKAEWLGQFRSDLSDFISRELVEAAVDHGVVARERLPGVHYTGFCDVAGGTGKDSFAAAVAHREGNSIVLDACLEIRPLFNPQTATQQAAELFKSYGISTVVADRYAVGFVIDAFKKQGISYRASERDRSTIYIESLPLFTAGRARLLDIKRLVTQIASLERRTVASGRDRVDAPREQHEDLANAVCGALVEVRAARAPLVITDDILRRAAMPAVNPL
ncbi:terminase [Bradyrhizobium sp. Arg314]